MSSNPVQVAEVRNKMNKQTVGQWTSLTGGKSVCQSFQFSHFLALPSVELWSSAVMNTL